jgi:hypothetical protein
VSDSNPDFDFRTFDVRPSIFDLRFSTFDLRPSTFDLRPTVRVSIRARKWAVACARLVQFGLSWASRERSGSGLASVSHALPFSVAAGTKKLAQVPLVGFWLEKLPRASPKTGVG